VAKLDNPAGRLHSLLSGFKAIADDANPILDQWAAVLETESVDETLVALAAVAGLVPAIERELLVTGDEEQMETFRTFSSAWIKCVTFPQFDGTKRPSAARTNLVNTGALAALGSISSFLSMASSEGVVPPPEAVDSLRKQAQRLLDSAVSDQSIEPAVRRILLDYIHRLIWALDHLRIGGPEAVHAASDRLIGQLQEASKPVGESVWARVADLVRTGWAMFRMGPQAAAALNGWQDVAGEIVKALPAGDGS
jgi:hypothetical protein